MSQSPRPSHAKPARDSLTSVFPGYGTQRLPTMVKRRWAALLVVASLLVVGAAAGLFSGCGGGLTTTTVAVVETTTTTIPPTTTTTEATTTTSTTEPPPVPLILAGYEQAVVRTVSVVIEDSYPKIEGGAAPWLSELVIDALETMGLVGIDAGLDCDAVLTFAVEGRALREQYSGDAGDSTDYSGAAYSGTAEFSVPGLDSQRWELSGRLDPPFMIIGSYPNPADAPFEAAFLEPMLNTLARVWGSVATIETIGVWPDFEDVIWGGAGDWVASVVAEVMPRLMEMRLSEMFDISVRAYDALAQIVERKAVPAEDRSLVVRTLISDMDSPDHYAGEALVAVAQPDDDGFYSSEDGMTYIGPWEAEKWSEWADAHGY